MCCTWKLYGAAFEFCQFPLFLQRLPGGSLVPSCTVIVLNDAKPALRTFSATERTFHSERTIDLKSATGSGRLELWLVGDQVDEPSTLQLMTIPLHEERYTYSFSQTITRSFSPGPLQTAVVIVPESTLHLASLTMILE